MEANPQPLRVLLVEDNDVFRQALELLLELQDGIEVDGAESEGSAAVAACGEFDPHVCVKCHYRSTELLWQCPHCHEWNSFVEERIAPAHEATVEM